ncbi:MAG TPA: beta-galactosidase [Dehalococcoidia bacterium]|nr:beta-galactosidase [Dehalococcoidia bacterium]
MHRRTAKRGAVVALIAGVFALTLLTGGTCSGGSVTPMGGYGLAEFGGWSDSAGMHSPEALGVNEMFDWADLEPADNVYDWSELDATLAAAHRQGKRIIPRVYTNRAVFGQATPDWVFDAGAAAYYNEPGSARQPVPFDPVFRMKFTEFLVAFGQRYDGNADIEFIQTNAGMGAYGEMVWGYPEAYRPPGWSPDLQITTMEYWVTRWRYAFPHTNLALMENYLGSNIAETTAQFAAARGFYLQANNPDQSSQSAAILATGANRTRIVLEIENNGCSTATGDAFRAVIDQAFSKGFPIDYLVVCGASFSDTGNLQYAFDRLRKVPLLR